MKIILNAVNLKIESLFLIENKILKKQLKI